MPKSNVLHSFIVDKDNNFTVKKDRYASNYVLHSLPLVKGLPHFKVNKKEEIILDHHLTVYENIEENIGYGGYYHYSICLENHTIRGYFNEQDEVIKIVIQDNGSPHDKLISDVLTGEEQNDIEELIENYALPVMKKIRKQQSILLEKLKQDYRDLTTRINEHLFDHSEDVATHLININEAIVIGEAILRYSAKPGLVKNGVQSLKRLNVALQNITTMPEPVMVDEPQNNQETIVEPPQPIVIQTTPVVATEAAQKAKRAAEIIEKFQTSYTNAQEKWATLKAINDIQQKIELFINFNAALSDLLFVSSNILEIAKDSKIEQHIITHADLGFTCIQSEYQEMGAALLTQCLNSENLFDSCAKKLTRFAPLLSQELLNDAIRTDDKRVLELFLAHGQLSINGYRIQVDEDTMYSLLSAAYFHESLECFIMLLQHNADSKILINGLPLAHTVLQLSTNNSFRAAFLQHCKPVRDANPSFYGVLSRALTQKLKDPTLLEEEKKVLIIANNDYAHQAQQRSREFELSPSVHANVAQIRQSINSEIMQELREMPEYRQRVQQIQVLENQLMQISQKKHATAQVKRAHKQLTSEVAKLVNENDQLGKNITPAQYLNELDCLIASLEAKIVLLELEQKKHHLSSAEAKKYNKAVKIVASYQHARNQALKQRNNVSSTHNVFALTSNAPVAEDSDSENSRESKSSVTLAKLRTRIHNDASFVKAEDDAFFAKYPFVHSTPPEERTPDHLALIIYPGSLFNQSNANNASPDSIETHTPEAAEPAAQHK